METRKRVNELRWINCWQSRASDLRIIFQSSLLLATFLILVIYNFPTLIQNIVNILAIIIVMFLGSGFSALMSSSLVGDLFEEKLFIEEKILKILYVISISIFLVAFLFMAIIFSLGKIDIFFQIFFIIYGILIIGWFIKNFSVKIYKKHSK
jgi:hypothetical protein